MSCLVMLSRYEAMLGLTRVLQSYNQVSVAGDCFVFFCILHNDTLTDVDLNHQPASCFNHELWQCEGAALPPPHVQCMGWSNVLSVLRPTVRRFGAQLQPPPLCTSFGPRFT